jgi:hypothetical protein
METTEPLARETLQLAKNCFHVFPAKPFIDRYRILKKNYA